MNIYEKLLAIQLELKAPKSQYNEFGKYNYRNCEDILEAAKPLCGKQKTVLFITDAIKAIEGRHYVEATATFIDCEKPDSKIIVTASAREEESKKGMDGSQVTGASSSYARKYALNGLFDIDDTKDSDTTNQGNKDSQAKPKQNNKPKSEKPLSKARQIAEIIKGTDVQPEQITEFITANFGEKLKVNDLNDEQFKKLYSAISKYIKGDDEQ